MLDPPNGTLYMVGQYADYNWQKGTSGSLCPSNRIIDGGCCYSPGLVAN